MSTAETVVAHNKRQLNSTHSGVHSISAGIAKKGWRKLDRQLRYTRLLRCCLSGGGFTADEISRRSDSFVDMHSRTE